MIRPIPDSDGKSHVPEHWKVQTDTMFISLVLMNEDSTYTIKTFNPGTMSFDDITSLLGTHFESMVLDKPKKRKQI
jgi:hypothetical protein